MIGFSKIGLFVFFAPITLGGETSIPLNHMLDGLRELMGSLADYYALAIIWAGAAYPFATGRYKNSTSDRIFSLLRISGAIVAVIALTGWGPGLLQSQDMLPFLFAKLVIPVGLIVPIGAV